MSESKVSSGVTDDSLSINSEDIVIPTRITDDHDDKSSPPSPSPLLPPPSRPRALQGLLTKLTEDVAELLRLRPTPTPRASERADLELTQQLTEMEKTAKLMMTNLTTYSKLLQTMQSETLAALNVSLPVDFETIKGMDQVYLQIDRLEGLTFDVASSTDALEAAVNLAEAELMPSTKTSVENFFRKFSPFSHSPSKARSELVLANYEEPDQLFRANTYFPEETE